jgi:hypothetical protein
VFEAIVVACAQSSTILLYEFYGRKLQPGESISKYALCIQDMLAKAVPNLEANQRNPFLRGQLCMQLPEHMRALVEFNDDKPWDELLAKLDKALPHVLKHEQSRSPFTAQQSNQKIDPFETLIKQEIDVNYNSSRQASSNFKPKTRFTGICDHCKIVGHKKAD